MGRAKRAKSTNMPMAWCAIRLFCSACADTQFSPGVVGIFQSSLLEDGLVRIAGLQEGNDSKPFNEAYLMGLHSVRR